MIIPVQITFRNVASTPEVEEKIRTRAQKLEKFYSPITTERKHLEVAIREAFHAARRRLEDHARRKRADVKIHEPMPQARVTKLFPVEGYGYIETPDGLEFYFHANSVLNNRFKSLKLGSKVSFTEEAGEKGPQASTVHLITRAARVTTAPPPGVTRPTKRKTA
jgi:cold shock CspA family protein